MASPPEYCSGSFVYEKDDVLPPVYITGSFNLWEIVEMQGEVKENGQYRFTTMAKVPENTRILYKIRIGEDNWVVDENQDSVIDANGNENNVVYSPDFSDVSLYPTLEDMADYLAQLDEERAAAATEAGEARDQDADGGAALLFQHEQLTAPSIPMTGSDNDGDAALLLTTPSVPMTGDDNDGAPAFPYEHAGAYPHQRLPSPMNTARRSSSDVSAEMLAASGPAANGTDNTLNLAPVRNLSRASLNSIVEEEPAGAARKSEDDGSLPGGMATHKDLNAVHDCDSLGPDSPGTVIHHDSKTDANDVSSIKTDDGNIAGLDGVSMLTEAGVNGDAVGEHYKVVGKATTAHSSGDSKTTGVPRVVTTDLSDHVEVPASAPSVHAESTKSGN